MARQTPERSRRLAVEIQVVGPHGRLGLAWALATVVALIAGPVWLALWLAPVAGLAGVQAARSWRPPKYLGHMRPLPAVAGGGAAVLTGAAAAGPQPTAAAAVVVVVGAVVAAVVGQSERGRPHAGLTAVIALLMGMAGACPVLLRADGLVPALVLLTFAGVYDTGAYLVGSGAATSWEGPAAGMAAIGAVTVAVATFLVPPFTETTPWVLGGLAAVSAPLGPLAGSALLGDRGDRVPFVRRLDSLLVMGPLWSLAVTQLID